MLYLKLQILRQVCLPCWSIISHFLVANVQSKFYRLDLDLDDLLLLLLLLLLLVLLLLHEFTNKKSFTLCFVLLQNCSKSEGGGGYSTGRTTIILKS
jgi:hypothetical protein